MSQELSVKARGELTPFQAQMRKDAAEPVPGERAGYAWISIKGREFHLAGSKVAAPFDCVILSAAFDYSFYEGAFDPESRALPDCFAIGRDQGTLAPHGSAPHPQATSCAVCPQGEWGSAPNGGGGKGCRQRLRLALMTADAAQQIAFMRVPPTSIPAWSSLVKRLRIQGAPMYGAVTRVGLDPRTTYAKLTFEVKELIDDERRVQPILDARAMVMDAWCNRQRSRRTKRVTTGPMMAARRCRRDRRSNRTTKCHFDQLFEAGRDHPGRLVSDEAPL